MDIRQKRTIDPIGVEVIVGILSLAVATVSTLHEFGYLPSRTTGATKEFNKLRELVLEAHNLLDDFVLIVGRFASQTDGEAPQGFNAVTLTDTLMELEERDYYRWIDMKGKLDELAKSASEINKSLRQLRMDMEVSVTAYYDPDLLGVYDKLFLNLSLISVADFVEQFREALETLAAAIANSTRNTNYSA